MGRCKLDCPTAKPSVVSTAISKTIVKTGAT